MKLVFILIPLLFATNLPPSDFYKIQVESVDGKTINLSDYKGKKILIAEFNAANPDESFLGMLDTLQNSDTGIVVIAVPATDFDGNTSNSKIKSLKADLNLNYLVTETGKVARNSGGSQLSLFKWLTSLSDNTHFDVDITSEGQMFLVSEKGELLAAVGKGTPPDIISQLLTKSSN